MSEKSLHTKSRFRSFRDNLQVYFLGLLTGLVLGGGFFLLKLDDYVKQFSKTFSGDKDKTVFSETPPEEKNDKDLKKTKTWTGNAAETNDKKNVTNETNPGDSLVYDSITGTSGISDNNNPDEIVVRKEELLGQRQAGIIELTQHDVDTALQKLSGIHDVPVKTVQIEFWQSPLNYRGYKMSKGKLVLFGAEPTEELTLYKMEDVVYMKNKAGVFRLDLSSDFRQAERINDATLLARLNK